MREMRISPFIHLPELRYFRTLSPEYRQQVVDRILGAN